MLCHVLVGELPSAHSLTYETHSCSWDFDEDGLDGGLTETHGSGYLHLTHITQILGQETHGLGEVSGQGIMEEIEDI